MKRIFIIQNTPLNAPLPLSVYLTGLLKNFKKDKNYEINLIIGKSKKIPKEINKLCNKIYQLELSTYSIKDNLAFSLKINSILKQENKKKKIDIIHCFYPNSSLLGAVLFKIFNSKIKIIYDIRSPWIDMSIERGFINKKIAFLYKTILYSEERFLCKFVNSFIFITNGLKDYYIKKVGIIKKQQIFVSPSGIDTKLFRKNRLNIKKKYNIKEDEILIGSVGGIAKIRKLDEFLNIFKKVVSHNKKLKLMFVGEGDALQQLKNLTHKLNLQKNVIFVGKVEHKEIPKYISAFDFGLCHLPDIFVYENSFPLKILEYLSCKVQVLSSELKTHFEISKKLEGIFIYKNDEDILKIINKNKNKKINPNLKDYSWSYIGKKYKKIWKKLK